MLNPSNPLSRASAGSELQRALRHHQAGQLAEAEAIYRKILGINPGDPDALHLLGVLAHQVGKHDVAIDLIGKAIHVSPLVPYYHDNMGNALKASGRLEDAVSHYRRALELQPDYPAACNNLAIALKATGRLEEAVLYYRRAIELKPDLPETHNNLGNALKDMGQLDESLSCYRKAILLRPDYAEALSNLGNALHDRGEAEEAIVYYEKALAIQPGLAETMNNLGVALHDQGKTGEAVVTFRKALSTRPGYPEALSNLGNALKDEGLCGEALSCYLKALEMKPGFAGAWSNYLLALHYDERSDRDVRFKVAVEGGREFFSRPRNGSFGNTPDPDRRIKVGYVSGDFRRHPVAYFMEAPLVHHDRARFEVFCYGNHHVHDEVTRRIQSLPVNWRDIAGLSDEEAERMIRMDGIDVLVDLSGHTARHRLHLFARKAAPVATTWIGYSDTTGMDAMDYIIADKHVIPEADEGYYVEKVARLPHSYLSYTPEAYAPEVSGLPALFRGYVTFGSFNNIAKVSYAALETWAKILLAIPGARLCIKTSLLGPAAVRDRYTKFFVEKGVREDRVDIAGKSSSHKELLARYGDIDIALDSFPYGGTTTTAEALWMGVPVITLAGDSFVSRVGSSFLSTVGLNDLIATTSDEYVAVARNLAGNSERLSSLRAGLREKMRRSPLCDGEAFTRDLEDGYRRMWKSWCDSRL